MVTIDLALSDEIAQEVDSISDLKDTKESDLKDTKESDLKDHELNLQKKRIELLKYRITFFTI